MSDTTPPPRSPESESESSAEESTGRHRTGEQPLTTSPDPADHTDTAVAPTVPAGYDPVAASGHVAPGPAVPALAAQSETTDAAPPADSPEQPTPPVEPAPAESAPVEAPPAESAPVEPTFVEPAPAEPAPATAAYADPGYADPAYAGPTYLPSPTPPQKRSNRGLGILIAILATIVFAAANAAATYGILLLHYGGSRAQQYLIQYVEGWEFWLPVAVFVVAFVLLVLLVNRGRWWGYVLGSVVVAALVFAGYFAAAVLTNHAWERTPDEFRTFTGDYFQSNIPYLWVATVVSVIALELVTWFGAWIAFHGQNAKRRNAEARAAYEDELDQASAR